jgi:hypothetical protein
VRCRCGMWQVPGARGAVRLPYRSQPAAVWGSVDGGVVRRRR